MASGEPKAEAASGIADLMKKRRVTACLKNEGDEGASTAEAEAEMEGKLNAWLSSTQVKKDTTFEATPSPIEMVAANEHKKKKKVNKRSGVFENKPQQGASDVRWSDKRTSVRCSLPGDEQPVVENAPKPRFADAGSSWKVRRATAAQQPIKSVFENAPSAAQSDTSWKEKRSSIRAPQPRCEELPSSVFESTPAVRFTDANWRERRTSLHPRKVVFENTPETSTAASSWKDRRITFRPSPVASLATIVERRPSEADAKSKAPSPPVAPEKPAEAPAVAAAAVTAVPKEEEKSKGGYDSAAAPVVASTPPADEAASTPAAAPEVAGDTQQTEDEDNEEDLPVFEAAVSEKMPQDLRAKVWTDRLGTESSEAGSSRGSNSVAVPVISKLLCAGSSEGVKQVSEQLAEAFVEKHLSWLAAGEEGSEPFFVALAHVLRYHSPWTAAAFEDTLGPVGLDLPSALDTICGGPSGLVQLLLEPSTSDTEETEALLLLCDLTVVEETHRMLLIFVVVVLLMEAPAEKGETFEQLHSRMQADVLSGIGQRGATGICHLAEAACALQEATPLSLSSALALGNLAASQLYLPMCAVDPAEVLHHIYEKPPGNWRLMVVDVRKKTNKLGFPVTLRFKPSQDKRALLDGLPFDESIHLCLMADGPPEQGEEAYELAQYLAGTSMRRHVSVVDGGWQAVSELAQNLNLEMTALQEDADEQSESTEAKKDDAALPTVVQKAFASATARVSGYALNARRAGTQFADSVMKNF